MNFKGIFSALLAAMLFGLIPTSSKLSYDLGANPALAILLRYTIAIILILVPLLSIGINFEKIKKHIVLLFLISIGSICLASGLLLSVTLIPVSMVALIFYTYPLIVLGYSLFSKKKINNIQLFGFISSFIGIALALGPTFNNLSLIGILLAFLASIGAATVLITNENLSKNFHPITINAFTNFTCFLVFSSIISLKFKVDFPTNNEGWFFVIFASLCYCMAFYSQLFSVKYIGSTRTSLLLYMEPIVAIISAIILLNEILSFIQITGICIVIISLILTTKSYDEIAN